MLIEDDDHDAAADAFDIGGDSDDEDEHHDTVDTTTSIKEATNDDHTTSVVGTGMDMMPVEHNFENTPTTTSSAATAAAAAISNADDHERIFTLTDSFGEEEEDEDGGGTKHHEEDSFNLIEQEKDHIGVVERTTSTDGILVEHHNVFEENDKSSGPVSAVVANDSKHNSSIDAFSGHDASTKELLEWLDDDDKNGDKQTNDRNRTTPTTALTHERSSISTSSGGKTLDSFDFDSNLWGSKGAGAGTGNVKDARQQQQRRSDSSSLDLSLSGSNDASGNISIAADITTLATTMTTTPTNSATPVSNQNNSSSSGATSTFRNPKTRITPERSTPNADGGQRQQHPSPPLLSPSYIKKIPVLSTKSSSSPVVSTTTISKQTARGTTPPSPPLFIPNNEGGDGDGSRTRLHSFEEMDDMIDGNGMPKSPIRSIKPSSELESSPPTFTNLSEAVRSPHSTVAQIKHLLQQQQHYRNRQQQHRGGGSPSLDGSRRRLNLSQRHNIASPISDMDDKMALSIDDEDDDDRKHIYVKLLCQGKTYEEVKQSSLAYSYTEWSEQQIFDTSSQKAGAGDSVMEYIQTQCRLLTQDMFRDAPAPQGNDKGGDTKQNSSATMTIRQKKERFCQDLVSLVTFYNQRQQQQQRQQKSTTVESKNHAPESTDDTPKSITTLRYIPSIMAALLWVIQDPATTSAVFHSLVSQYMPLLALTLEEQYEASQKLSKYFYLLTLYNHPSIAMHLDQFLPGWFHPKIHASFPTDMKEEEVKKTISSNDDENDQQKPPSSITNTSSNRVYKHLEQNGVVPLSWFVATFAGIATEESDDYNSKLCHVVEGLRPTDLVQLWDTYMIQQDTSTASSAMKYFLMLTCSEKHSHEILRRRNSDDLKNYMSQHVLSDLQFTFSSSSSEDSTNSTADTTVSSPTTTAATTTSHSSWLLEWWNHSLHIKETQTPSSYLLELVEADDNVVTQMIQQRQLLREQEMKRRMKEESLKHAKEEVDKIETLKQQIRRDMRTKLIRYYQTVNPDRTTEAALEKILTVYDGRYDVLDEKLGEKYTNNGFLSSKEVRLYRIQQRQIVAASNKLSQIAQQTQAMAEAASTPAAAATALDKSERRRSSRYSVDDDPPSLALSVSGRGGLWSGGTGTRQGSVTSVGGGGGGVGHFLETIDNTRKSLSHGLTTTTTTKATDVLQQAAPITNNIDAIQNHVVMHISTEEVIPQICASKALRRSPTNSTTGSFSSSSPSFGSPPPRRSPTTNNSSSPSLSLSPHSHHYIKYFLVDARPLHSTKTHGRFPTAIHIPPSSLLDPDLIEKELETVESLRGSVHIVIMGEGLDAIPSLYDHVLSPKELSLKEEDKSRTEIAAFFFVKLGFPYVSILDGGFAKAHSLLYRNTSEYDLSKVLVDYETHTSLWAKLEQAHKEPTLGEMSRQIADLVGNGINSTKKRLTATKHSIEEGASHLDLQHKLSVETAHLSKSVNNFFGGVQQRLDQFNQHLAESQGIDLTKKKPHPAIRSKSTHSVVSTAAAGPGLPPRPITPSSSSSSSSGSGSNFNSFTTKRTQSNSRMSQPSSSSNSLSTTTAAATTKRSSLTSVVKPTTSSDASNPWSHLKLAFSTKDILKQARSKSVRAVDTGEEAKGEARAAFGDTILDLAAGGSSSPKMKFNTQSYSPSSSTSYAKPTLVMLPTDDEDDDNDPSHGVAASATTTTTTTHSSSNNSPSPAATAVSPAATTANQSTSAIVEKMFSNPFSLSKSSSSEKPKEEDDEEIIELFGIGGLSDSDDEDE